MADALIIPEGALLPDQVQAQVQLIQHLMASVMKDGEHYGVIPGCGTKKALMKAGAEKLCFTFQLVPTFDVTLREYQNHHREYDVRCKLSSRAGVLIAEGVGTCSTLESKYRYRKSARKCPECGKETIIKGRREYGGGWLCYAKRGGCGAKWEDGAAAIEAQEEGQVENPDPADQWNTVLKMAKKRAQVDATITACAASDLFTQDIDENADLAKAELEPQGNAEAPRQQPATSGATPASTSSTAPTSTPKASAAKPEPTAAQVRESKTNFETMRGSLPDGKKLDPAEAAKADEARATEHWRALKEIDAPLAKALWKATASGEVDAMKKRADAFDAVHRGCAHALELWGDEKGYEHIEYVKQESGWPWGIEKNDTPAPAEQIARLVDLCRAVATVKRQPVGAGKE